MDTCRFTNHHRRMWKDPKIINSCLILGVTEESSSTPLPHLVDRLTDTDTSDKTEINGITYDENLLKIMKASIQYPHVAEENQTKRNMPSGAAFPFCHYSKEDTQSSGIRYIHRSGTSEMGGLGGGL